MSYFNKLVLAFVFIISMIWEFVGKNLDVIMFFSLIAGVGGLTYLAIAPKPGRGYA